MGSFYGNITNTSKTQFQFDKIYPNRYEMEKQKSIDGIYAGRYVLVEYDSAYQQDDSYRVWIFGNKIYSVNEENDSYLIRRSSKEVIENKKLSSVPAGTIVFTADNKISSSTGYYYTNVKYYQITEDNPIGQAASFKEIVNGLDIPNYTINYNIDISTYGAGRGYDSTVWQKAYIDGYEKYIMIAELNSVVPTFDVSADAPTMDPLIPHFDTQSTDIYYKLHWQPSWGFRVTEGETDSRKTESEDNNAGNYPSDIEVSYNKNSYNASTGKNIITKISYPGAIFFNKAGLDEATHNEYDGEFKNTNEISIQPTGLSGNKYNTHDGSLNVEKAPDIQEIKVLLPALGNILCNVWDKVYGYDPNNNKRYRDTQWKDARTRKKFEGEIVPQPDNLGEEDLGYMTRDSETVAGCINLVHDLLGMILVNGDVSLNEVTYSAKRIYYRDGRYYRIYKYPIYEKVNVSAVTNLNPGKFPSDQEYNIAFETAVNDILKDYPDEDWYLVIAENGGETGNWQVQRFNKKALTNKSLNDKALAHIKRSPDGNILYNYKWQEIKGFANDLSTINGLILELRTLIESDDLETRNRETVQGTINTLNDIINIFEDLVPGEFLICDANGHINSANWTTKQAFEYTNIGDITNSSQNPVENENQWIKVDLDENNRLISIAHQAHKVKDTEHQSDINGSSDVISLYSPIVDNTGHIVGNHTETVILPYGFKYVQPNDYNNKVVDDAVSNTEKIEADNTQDNLLVGNSNKWIKISANSDTDTLSIGHEVHDFESGEANTFYGLTQDETVASLDEKDNAFKVPCIKFDEAGHIIDARTHTVVLPDNFTKVEVTASTQQGTLGTSKSDVIEADTMTDTLTFAEGDHWINLAADKANDKVTIYHAAPGKQTGTTAIDNETPKFGETIIIPEVSYDKTGHIINVSTHTAKIPQPSLNDVTADGAIVLTGLSMEDTTGAIAQTHANVGTLKLTDYSKGTDKEAVADDDTINAAFSKLQTHIDSTDSNISQEVADRKTAIIDAIAALANSGVLTSSETIGTWEETNGKISIIPQPIVIANDNVAADAAINISKISIGDNTIAMGKINGLIGALDGKQPAGKYEISGAATAVQNSLIGTDKDTATTLTLNGLLARIKALEDRVTILESKSGV